MQNPSELLRWRLSGHLNLSNTRSGFQNSPIPKEVISDFQLENCRESHDPNTGYAATTLAVQSNRLATSLDSGDIIFQDKTTLEPIHNFQAHSAAIFDLKWRQSNTDGSPNNGRNFITASGDRSIVFWDAETCSKISVFHNAHTGSVKTLSFHDANLFASGGRDGSVKLWDLRTVNRIHKYGSEFCIENAHAPPLVLTPGRKRTPRAKASTTTPQKNSPANVVTSVMFKPQFKYHLYTSGVADNAVKMWDIRGLRRPSFQLGSRPIVDTVHTIKNCSPNSTGSGFNRLMALNVSKFGNVLLASCSDNRIYAFVNNEIDPVIAFSGARPGQYASINLFKNEFLLSGSRDGKVYAWNLYRELENAFKTDNKENIVANCLPSYYFSIGEERDQIDCLAVDDTTSRLYNLTNDFQVYQWSLYTSKIDEQRIFGQFAGRLPKAQAYAQPEARNDIVLRSSKRMLDQCSTSSSQNAMATPPKRRNFFRLPTC